MTKQNPDLDDNAPDQSATALIIIDMINDLEFPGGEDVLEPAVAAAKRIAALKQRAAKNKIPVIYANDNFGRWQSNFNQAVEHCLSAGVRGEPLAELLQPEEQDYFVLKTKHSAFYATPLDLLLSHLGTTKLILCGLSGHMCVQFTACDAYMRDFELYVPADCIASATEPLNRRALQYMQQVLKADSRSSQELDLKGLARPNRDD